MTINKIAYITDSHAGIRSDSMLFANYQERFYKEVFFPKLVEENIKHIFHLGDYWDRRKFVNFEILQKNRECFLDLLVKHDIHMHIIAGNHDVAMKNTNDINSLNLLFGDYKDRITIYENKPEIMELFGVRFMWIPWINVENYQSVLEFIEENDADVVNGHFEISGFEMYKGVKHDAGLSPSMFVKFSNVFSGHFHHKSQRGNIQYLGAPMEFTWSDYDDPRGFHVLSIEDNRVKNLEFFQNPYKMFHKIVYNDTIDLPVMDKFYDNVYVKLIVAAKTNPEYYETFVESLQKQNVADLAILENDVEYIEDSSNIEFSPESGKPTIEILCDHVTNTNNMTQKQKQQVNSLLRELYTESLSE